MPAPVGATLRHGQLLVAAAIRDNRRTGACHADKGAVTIRMRSPPRGLSTLLWPVPVLTATGVPGRSAYDCTPHNDAITNCKILIIRELFDALPGDQAGRRPRTTGKSEAGPYFSRSVVVGIRYGPNGSARGQALAFTQAQSPARQSLSDGGSLKPCALSQRVDRGDSRNLPVAGCARQDQRVLAGVAGLLAG